jgi:2'-5' RNA ligase
MKLKLFEEFVNRLKEKKGDSYSKGCVMAYLDSLQPQMKELQSKISEEDIYTEEGDRTFGFEDEPHVTLLYGIHSDEVSDDEVMKIMEEMNWKQMINIGHIGLFENEKYDVLKLEASADWLREANKALCEKLPYSTDFPDYNPHVTVAYLKPGTGKRVVEELGSFDVETAPDKIVYSLPNGEKKFLK